MGHPTQREPPPQRVQPSPTPKAILTVSLPAAPLSCNPLPHPIARQPKNTRRIPNPPLHHGHQSRSATRFHPLDPCTQSHLRPPAARCPHRITASHPSAFTFRLFPSSIAVYLPLHTPMETTTRPNRTIPPIPSHPIARQPKKAGRIPNPPPQAPASLCHPGSPTCPLHPVTPPTPRCALSPQDHRLPKSPHPASRKAQPRTHSTILTCLPTTRDPTPLRSPPTMRSPHRHRPMPLPETHRPSHPPCAASSDRVFTLALPLRATDKQSHERTIRDFSGRPSGA
jgi:hypothetical protein